MSSDEIIKKIHVDIDYLNSSHTRFVFHIAIAYFVMRQTTLLKCDMIRAIPQPDRSGIQLTASSKIINKGARHHWNVPQGVIENSHCALII